MLLIAHIRYLPVLVSLVALCHPFALCLSTLCCATRYAAHLVAAQSLNVPACCAQPVMLGLSCSACRAQPVVHSIKANELATGDWQSSTLPRGKGKGCQAQSKAGSSASQSHRKRKGAGTAVEKARKETRRAGKFHYSLWCHP